ncbi:hypothetical protein KUCAC02_000277, partial [Chaenocephalus aceratus]
MILNFVKFFLLWPLCVAQTDDISQPVPFQMVKIGDSATIECHIKSIIQKRVWYKYTLGKRLQLVVAFHDKYNWSEISEEFPNRYSAKFNGTKIHLSISATTWEDVGTYFCGVVQLKDIQFGSGTFLMLKDNAFESQLKPTIIALMLSNVALGIMTVILISTLCKSRRRDSTGWISASVSQTVEVQPGEEVTLLCLNISIGTTKSDWFRVLNGTKPSCVSSIYGAEEPDEMTYLTSLILGCLAFLLTIVVIVLAVKIRKLQRGSTSVPVSVEVQPGENATLTCANISKYDTMTYWFRLVNRTEVSCVDVLMNSYSKVSYCDGVQKSKFEMTSNSSNLFLEIQQVDVSDTGLYFCGFYIAGIPYFSNARLTITGGGEEIGKDMPWMTLTLGSLTVFFMVAVIVLVVKIRKIQK